MILSIAAAFYMILGIDGSILCIRIWASKTNKVGTKSSGPALLLTTWTAIWNTISLLIMLCRSSIITLYAWYKMAWYYSSSLIDQWASTNTFLIVLLNEVMS